MSNKLTVKDLINVGVFSALYIVLFFVTSFLGYIPILMLLLPVVCAVVVGIPFMLFLSKTHTFGMVTIMSIILGLFMLLLGRPWPVLLIAVAAGAVTDIILKSKDYSSVNMSVTGSGVFSLWMMGMVLPCFFGYREPYFETIREGYGNEFADALYAITPNWMFFVMLILCFAGGILGGVLGSSVLKKHFKRAGMV